MKYLGNKDAFSGLDTFEAPSLVERVIYTSDEVTALCPVTGQPDQYIVTIELSHSRHLIESKSLKLYLQSFRSKGIFCEAFAARVADDARKATLARRCSVVVRQKPRGGVAIEALAISRRDSDSEAEEE